MNIDWNPPSSWQAIETIDMHTGGEPLRIPISGLPDIKGCSVLEKRRYFMQHFDHLRTGLMFEPRGHADMYGAIITDPSTKDADFDVFFIHNEGYSTMCGHAVIALTKFAIETNLVSVSENRDIVMNVPAGQIKAQARIEDGTVVQSSFLNVPSFLYLKNKDVEVPGIGHVHFDIAFGGAYYAVVSSDPLKLKLDGSDYSKLIDYGRKIKEAVSDRFDIVHPVEDDLSFLYGTIFVGAAYENNHHSRNVCIFAEGEVDRSATGSGVSARAGLHYAKGELELHSPITIESILGSTMTVEAIKEVAYYNYKAVVPKVSGSASYVSKNIFCFDPKDPYRKGFIFR